MKRFWHKRIERYAMVLLCAVIVFLPMQKVQAQGESVLLKASFASVETMGMPLSGSASAMIMETCYGTDPDTGHPVMYTFNKSTPGYFNVIDLTSNLVIDAHAYPGGDSFSWGMATHSSGDVYVGVTQGSVGTIMKYDPNAKTFVAQATIPASYYIYNLKAVGDELFFGTYPNGRLYRYNVNTKAFYQYTNLTGFSYARAVDVSGDYIYVGVATTTYDNCLKKVNRYTGAVTTLALSQWVKDQMNEGVTNITGANCEGYSVDVRGDYLIVQIKDKRENTEKNHAIFYKISTGQWLEKYVLKYQGLHPSPIYNNKAYFTSGGKLWSFDLSTEELVNTGMNGAAFIRTGTFISKEGQTEPVLISLSAYAKLEQYDFHTMTFNNATVIAISTGGTVIRSIRGGPNGRVYIGGYLSGQAKAYNPANDFYTSILNFEQTEGWGSVGGKMYGGTYGGATIRVIDTGFDAMATTVSQESTFTITGQDRPYVLSGGGDGNMYIGTVPSISKWGGAVAKYESTTHALTIFDADAWSVDQSVAGLAYYQNGLIYIGTNVSGGTSTGPKTTEAKIVLFDTNTGTSQGAWTFMQIPKGAGVSVSEAPKSIGHLVMSPYDGLLWGVTMKSVFAIDPTTNQMVKYRQISPGTADRTWTPCSAEFGENGLLYTGIGSQVTVVDTQSMDYYMVPGTTGMSEPLVTLGGDGAIYYAKSANMYRVKTTMQNVPQYVVQSATGAIVTGDEIIGIEDELSETSFATGIMLGGGTFKVFDASETVEITGNTLIGTGMKLNIYNWADIVQRQYDLVVVGDITGNGMIDALDLLSQKRHILRIATLQGAFLKGADITQNGVVNSTDLLRLQRIILGLEPQP